MLDLIGEIAVRMTTRTEAHQTSGSRDLVVQKTENVVEKRPIENTGKSATAESSTKKETEGYNLDNGDIFYEKYDKNGNVIIRVPQEKKPINELL